MKIAFIIAEYNPFHCGHAFHAAQTREKSGADAVVAVMSGNFTQRGLPAAADKYTRALIAVRCGIDCVVELPFPFAAGAAPDFAGGAVKLAAALSTGRECVLSFGSESGDLAALEAAADILSRQPEEYRLALRQELEGGLPYAQAAARALSFVSGTDILSGSNDILAAEYLKNLAHCKNILPLAIKREGGGHYETATKIREFLEAGKTKKLKKFLPPPSLELITKHMKEGAVSSQDIFGSLLLYRLRSMTAAELAAMGENEGLYNRLRDAALLSPDLPALLAAAATRRYSPSRISRALLYALLSLTAEKHMRLRAAPPYAKILAIKKDRKDILSAFSTSSAHIITRSDDLSKLPPDTHEMYKIEKAASDIYALTLKNKELRAAPQEKMLLV